MTDWIDEAAVSIAEVLRLSVKGKAMRYVVAILKEHYLKAARCPTCEGSGDVKGTYRGCPTCHGRGLIVPETKLESNP
jgi:DnaJ-class molecular chaperone